MPTVELRFTALPSHVRTARLVAAAVARRCGLDEAVLDEVRLAVGEACSRAVDLHRRFCPERPVMVTLIDDDTTLPGRGHRRGTRATRPRWCMGDLTELVRLRGRQRALRRRPGRDQRPGRRRDRRERPRTAAWSSAMTWPVPA